jgi:hypothetical protein
MATSALVLVVHGHLARGDDWKDGCPPYFEPVPSAASFGPSAQPDTSLGPSRFAMALDRPRITGLAFAASPSHIVPPAPSIVHGFLHFNSEQGPTVSADYAFARDPDLQGNASVFVGYRHVTTWFDDALRSGASVRFGIGDSPAGIGRQSDTVNTLAVTMPFGARYFGFGRTVTGTLEGRLELVGCYAPFIHLRLETTEWRLDPIGTSHNAHNKQPMALVVPLSLSVGGYVTPRIGIATEFAVELRTPRSILVLRDLFRVRNVIDLQLPSGGADHHCTFHLLLHADFLTGNTTGYELGVAASVDGAWSGAFE